MEKHMENGCPVVLDVTGTDIHAEAERVRALGPAVQVELPGGVKAWMLTSNSVVRKVLTDPRVTKSARAHWPAFTNGEIPPDWELISWVAMDNISTSWGKDHLRLRRLVGKAFTPRRIEAIKPRIVELTNQLLDGLATAEPGEVVDLRQRFAYPLPAKLVADIIGMDHSVLEKTAVVINMMVDTTVSPETAHSILTGWREAMIDFIASKRANPGEDITSDLIAARDDEDGSRLTEGELTDTIFAILGAGSETTINFLSNAVTQLLSNRDQLEQVIAGTLSWDSVLEEVLRVQAPLASLPLRFAADDIELDGVTIRKGDPILVNYTAVGRDPEVHGASACEFDVARADKEHISFGYGPHYCLGAGIARLVGSIGLSTLFERFPEISLAVPAEELQPLPTFIMNGHRELPVRLTARVPAEAH
ncbi:cytochrome P450 [Sphaerisporangium sp. TRM90804]|uniref:cytochrome P450 family protein n=1 Tax=Sphaerisporangium sp. TRM90804 TaxID=3031113 RepID=UPI00244AA9BE|nr:cytochrome P450 [Sphaerisporangium sp. TRM90804]MDH2424513.1 cytochrome P450 [Sphaerisporangium sp. TRM90804]